MSLSVEVATSALAAESGAGIEREIITLVLEPEQATQVDIVPEDGDRGERSQDSEELILLVEHQEEFDPVERSIDRVDHLVESRAVRGDKGIITTDVLLEG